MQRLSSTPRNKENIPNTKDRHPQGKEGEGLLDVGQDLVFLLSSFTGGMLKKEAPLAAAQEDAGEYLKVTTPYAFPGNFELEKHLKHVHIKGSCLVTLRAFEGLSLTKLEFEHVLLFEHCKFENFRVSFLILRDLQIKTAALARLISTLNPLSLELVDVHLTDADKNSNRGQLYGAILASNIRSFSAENSFISTSHFFGIVQKKGIKKFCYRSGDAMIKYSVLGRGFSYFMSRGPVPIEFFDRAWLSVDLVNTDSNSTVMSSIQAASSKIKFLWLENTRLTVETVRRLPSLVSIYLSNCAFDDMSFGEFVNRQRPSLRYASFSSVDLPFDWISSISKGIKGCKVVCNSVTVVGSGTTY